MKLLINDVPLIVLPRLAELIGLNEAIFLQQLHYWLNHSSHKHEGCSWIYNTVSSWSIQFPFWSEETIRRIIKNLKNNGLIETTSKFNQKKYDKTHWFTINYQSIETLEEQVQQKATSQIDQTVSKATSQIDHMHVVKMTTPIPEITRDKNSQPEKPAALSQSIKEISDHAWFTHWWCFVYGSINGQKYPYKKKHAGQIDQLLKSLNGDLVELVARTCSYFILPSEKLFPPGRTIGGLQYMIDQLSDLDDETFDRFVAHDYLPDPEGDLSLKQFQPWKDGDHVKAAAS